MLFRVYEFLLAAPVLVGLDYGNLEVPCRGSIFVWQYLDSFSYDRIGQQEGFQLAIIFYVASSTAEFNLYLQFVFRVWVCMKGFRF